MRLDDAAGSGFAIVAIGVDAQAIAAAVDAGAIGLGDIPRIAIVPQKVALAPEDYEGIAIGRDADDILSSVTGRARNMLVLMRPDREDADAGEFCRSGEKAGERCMSAPFSRAGGRRCPPEAGG